MHRFHILHNFSSLFLFNFEINGYFHIFFLYFCFWRGGGGFGEGDIGDFIIEIVLTE